MLEFFTSIEYKNIAIIGIIFSFAVTFYSMTRFRDFLPSDQGRAFAVDGAKSAGKPRGAGIIFVLAFVISVLIFGKLTGERIIYLVLVTIEMLTGYFDDAADEPWNEYLKGGLDLLVAVATAITYITFNGTNVYMPFVGASFELPKLVYAVLVVILVWAAINVTNCSDGVDGLCGTLSVTTILSFVALQSIIGTATYFSYMVIIFISCLGAYLWFNAYPSSILMGDAGSRAIGIFIAIVALKSQCPFLYIGFAFVTIMDGGLGLIKVALLRFLKIHILKNVTTPIHDHARKNYGWSNTQVVFRFAINQIAITIAIIGYIMM